MTDHDHLLDRVSARAYDPLAQAEACNPSPSLVDDLAAALRAVEAERDALRRIVRRFGPPPGGLLLDPDEADALRNALKETTDGE